MTTSQDEVIVIKLAHYAEIGHPADIAANQFAERVEQRTKQLQKRTNELEMILSPGEGR